MGESLHLARYNDNGKQSNGIDSVAIYTCISTLIYKKLQKIAYSTTISSCRLCNTHTQHFQYSYQFMKF